MHLMCSLTEYGPLAQEHKSINVYAHVVASQKMLVEKKSLILGQEKGK